ncbi:hypothetical protein Ancab_001188 [Ancistrocladus abbreviatus]
MGNCFTKQKKKSAVEIAPSDYSYIVRNSRSPPIVTLSGDPTSSFSYYLRFALRHKPISLHFIPSQCETASFFTLQYRNETVSGSAETVLQYMEEKVPRPPLLTMDAEEEEAKPLQLVVKIAELQHKSMKWHVERVVRWGMDLATRGGTTAVNPGVGTPRMEVRKFEKSYGKLLEIMLEHAQMEEKIIFPILQMADRGLCRSANEEHARDLPIMNGIKEDIKSVGALNAGTPTFREALYNLSARLEILQENCKEHFEEEEKLVFPLMEATELTREQERRVINQCIDVMQGTHSYLFAFFIEGLLPHEAMQYLDLIMNYDDRERVTLMLRTLVD